MAKNDNDSTEVVEREQKASPVEAGEPEEAVALSQMGGTFAERAAARLKQEKRLSKDSDDVEDKAVKKASTKKKS